MEKILSEMGFFASLLLLSEIARRWVKSKSPGSLVAQQLLICSLVLAWFTVSITLILFNKWVISSRGGEDGQMTFPIFYTMTHMALKGIFACCYYYFVQLERSLPKVSLRIFLGLSLAGVFAAFDIVTSNLSFLYISASFYTFLKASSLLFILLLAILCCLEPMTVNLVSTVVLISTGMFLASYGEADFNLTGFSLVMVSEAFAAMRWITTQILLEHDDCGPMTAVLYMSPGATLALVPFVIVRERAALAVLDDWASISSFGVLILFPGFLAFLLLLVEVQIIKETSSLTMTVFGNLKSVVTIIFAVLVFKERTTLLQWAGLLVALTGMIAYSHERGEWVSPTGIERVKSGLLPRLESGDNLADLHRDDPEVVGSPTERTSLLPMGQRLSTAKGASEPCPP